MSTVDPSAFLCPSCVGIGLCAESRKRFDLSPCGIGTTFRRVGTSSVWVQLTRATGSLAWRWLDGRWPVTTMTAERLR
jgi:hypothetical protein